MKQSPLWKDMSISVKHFLKKKIDVELTPRQKYIRFLGIKRLALAKFILGKYARKKPKNNVVFVVAICIALHEKRRFSEHTLVNQAVECLKKTNNQKTVAFGNYVLRRILTDLNLFSYEAKYEEIKWNAPIWWIEYLKQQVRDVHLRKLLLRSLSNHPPLNLRLNNQKKQTEVVVELKKFNRKLLQVSSHGLSVIPPLDIVQTSVFKKGLVSVQDISSQQIIDLVEPRSDGKVLDICAAPGGKSLAIATNIKCQLFSNDKSKVRLQMFEREISRIKEQLVTVPKITCFNPLDSKQLDCLFSLTSGGFDYIILDAPCSGSGLQRRHPEIPWTKTRQQLEKMLVIQSKLLDASWKILKNRGILIYCICSIFYNEGEGQVVEFQKRTKNVNRKSAPGLIYPTVGKQYFSDNDIFNKLDSNELKYIGNDGFFYAILEK